MHYPGTMLVYIQQLTVITKAATKMPGNCTLRINGRILSAWWLQTYVPSEPYVYTLTDSHKMIFNRKKTFDSEADIACRNHVISSVK